MPACGSLHHMFENSLPENQTLLESLSSWNQTKRVKPDVDHSSFTEIFGELHFKENLELSSTTSNSSNPKANYSSSCHKRSDSFSSLNSESLQLCTEGLGFESSDDVENLMSEMKEDWESGDEKMGSERQLPSSENAVGEIRRSRTRETGFPPPISCIARNGRPGVCFKSYRQDGRFVLKEVRIPTQELLQASREDGRLKLHFVQPEDEIPEEEEQEDENENEDGKEDNDAGKRQEEYDDFETFPGKMLYPA